MNLNETHKYIWVNPFLHHFYVNRILLIGGQWRPSAGVWKRGNQALGLQFSRRDITTYDFSFLSRMNKKKKKQKQRCNFYRQELYNSSMQNEAI